MTVFRAWGDGAWRDPQYAYPLSWPNQGEVEWQRYRPPQTLYPANFEWDNSDPQGWTWDGTNGNVGWGDGYMDCHKPAGTGSPYGPSARSPYATDVGADYGGQPYSVHAQAVLAAWNGVGPVPHGFCNAFFQSWNAEGMELDFMFTSVGQTITLQTPAFPISYFAPDIQCGGNSSGDANTDYTVRWNFVQILKADNSHITEEIPGITPHVWQNGVWVPQDAPFS